MLISVIAILEPQSYFLDKSASWTLIQALQKHSKLFVMGADGEQFGQIEGATSLLQPIRVTAANQSLHLMFMKTLINIQDFPTMWAGQPYSVQDENGETLLPLLSCSDGSPYVTPFLGLAPTLPALDESSAGALENFILSTTDQLWSDQPINNTTNHLWLSPSGEFATRAELTAKGAGMGQLVVQNGRALIEGGLPTPPGTYTFAAWKGAGKPNILPLGGSGSLCTNGTPSFTFYSTGDGYDGYYDAGGNDSSPGDGGAGDGAYGDGGVGDGGGGDGGVGDGSYGDGDGYC
jgi:hypothetical protein